MHSSRPIVLSPARTSWRRSVERGTTAQEPETSSLRVSTRRHPQTERQQQFCRDPLLAPRRIGASHGGYQLLEIRRYRWTARCRGLPPPEEAESFAMPTDQGVRLHDRERGSPVDQPCEHDEDDPCRIIGTAGLDSALSIERQLLPEKEILGRQLRPRLKMAAVSNSAPQGRACLFRFDERVLESPDRTPRFRQPTTHRQNERAAPTTLVIARNLDE